MSKNTENQGKVIEGHVYDGIQELDNSLPNWWLATFYITIVFSFFYYLYYQVGSGPGLVSEYNKDKAEYSQKMGTKTPSQGPSESEVLAVIKTPTDLNAGKQVYMTKCASCHGAQGQGVVGPNLTDKYWIHGGKPLQILATIKQGVLDKGMPPWGTVLSDRESTQVAGYIVSLKGTNPPNPKAPQGVLEE